MINTKLNIILIASACFMSKHPSPRTAQSSSMCLLVISKIRGIVISSSPDMSYEVACYIYSAYSAIIMPSVYVSDEHMISIDGSAPVFCIVDRHVRCHEGEAVAAGTYYCIPISADCFST